MTAGKPSVHLDVETFSTSPLPKVGAYQYMRHPTTGMWLFAFRFDHKERPTVIQLWDEAKDLGKGRIGWQHAKPWTGSDAYELAALLNHIGHGGTVIAHNAGFELDAWNTLLVPEMAKRGPGSGAGAGQSWPELRLEQMDCTMARCNAMALPGGLEDVAKVLRLPEQKDMGGATLMRAMMVGSPGNVDLCTRDNLDRLGSYCAQDVQTEFALDKKLPQLAQIGPLLKQVWFLDQRINARGIPFDIERIQRAKALAAVAREEANTMLEMLTSGAVKAVTENKKFLEWLNGRPAIREAHPGLDSVGDFELECLLDEITGIDELAWHAINIRRSAAKSSLAKLDAITLACGIDPDQILMREHGLGHRTYKGVAGQTQPLPGSRRARGQYYLMGAGPGRWTGKNVQPQNLVRFDEEKDRDAAEVLGYALDNMENDKQALRYIEEKTGCGALDVMSRCLRTFIKAQE